MPRREAIEASDSLGGGVFRCTAGCIDPVQSGIRGFLPQPVRAGGLAKLLRSGCLVQDVIGDLEGQTNPFAIGSKRSHLRIVSAGQNRPDLTTGGNQGAGLSRMDIAKGLGVDDLTFGLDIHHLPTDQAVGPRGNGQAASRLHNSRGRVRRKCEDLESQCEQRISRKDRYGFSELLVRCRHPAAQIVVVDGG